MDTVVNAKSSSRVAGLRRLGLGRRKVGRSGFALLATLAVLAITSVVTAAMLGWTLTASKSAFNEAERASQTRAAEGALETAINQIRSDPTGTTGTWDPEDPSHPDCDPFGSTIELDGETVEVNCTTAESDLPYVPASTGTDNVKIVGSGTGLGKYQGTVPWQTNCPPGDPGPACFPWLFGIGSSNYSANQSELSSTTANLVHSGPSPLRFASNVQVRTGAATMLNPVSGDSGIDVGGNYQQGNNGLFSSAGGGACGILSPTHPWNVGPARVLDINAEPACNDAAAQALGDADALPTPSNPWTPSAVGAAAQTASATCPGGPVVAYAPGSYNRIQTKRISDLLGGACPNKTFYFAPGDYWFDVNDVSAPAPGRYALTINDPTARVVFGTPKGWSTSTGAAADDFPQACDPNAAGVSITLTGQSSIRHLAGRVAICDKPVSGQAPAIYQTPGVDTGWIASATGVGNLPDTAHPGAGSDNFGNFSNVSNALVRDGAVASSQTDRCWFDVGGRCSYNLALLTTGWGTGQPDPGPAMINSAQVLVTADSQKANDDGNWWWFFGSDGAHMEISVWDAGRSTELAPLCTVGYSRIPDDGRGGWRNTISYELLDPGAGDCAGQITDRSQLRNSAIRVNYFIDAECFVTCVQSVEVDSVGLRTSWNPRASTASGTSWSNPSNALDRNGGSASTRKDCGAVFDCPTITRSLLLSGWDDLSEPPPPSSPISSLGVTVRGTTDDANGDASRTRVIVNPAGGGQCSVTYLGLPNWSETIYLDLLSPPSGASGTCAGTVTNSEQLVGASTEVQFVMDCAPDIVCTDPWPFGDARSFGVDIDHIGMSATFAPYTRPANPMVVTINDAPGTAGDAMFTVYGQTSMPRNDVDIRWTGTPVVADSGDGPRDVPVFNGTMVVNGIGSSMDPGATAGVVCCAPARPQERIVELTASVDGVIRAVATVRIIDAKNGLYSKGESVDVIDWRQCAGDNALSCGSA